MESIFEGDLSGIMLKSLRLATDRQHNSLNSIFKWFHTDPVRNHQTASSQGAINCFRYLLENPFPCPSSSIAASVCITVRMYVRACVCARVRACMCVSHDLLSVHQCFVYRFNKRRCTVEALDLSSLLGCSFVHLLSCEFASFFSSLCHC